MGLRLSRTPSLALLASALIAGQVLRCSPSGRKVTVPRSEQLAASSRPALSSAALPPSLVRDAKDLRDLQLPASTTDLKWMESGSLESLAVAGSKITSLQGAPSSLRELDVSNTDLESLGFLPTHLRSLDIRNTRIRQLEKLSPWLEVLKISGSALKDPSFLPSGLRELHLEDATLQDFSELPRSLEELYLTGRGFEQLNGLPPFLRALSLQGTHVGSLKNLPDSLQEISLVDNRMRFAVADLPERLTELTLDRQPAPADLSGLRYLAWLSDLREAPAIQLPPSLTCLTLRANRLSRLPELPPFLLALGLIGASFSPVASLPPGLQHLSLKSYRGPALATLPPTLKKFSLESSSLSKLPRLPSGLEELDIRQTAIDDLSGAPAGLKKLVVCETRMKEISGLKERFPHLQRLELCNSASLEAIGPLPETLQALNISHTSIHRLPKLGPALEELDLSKTPIRLATLRTLPRTLKILVLSDNQAASWQGLPPHLQVLRIEEADGEPGAPP